MRQQASKGWNFSLRSFPVTGRPGAFVAAAFIALGAVAADEVKPTCADGSLAGYKLSWGDEFEGTDVDASKWNFRTGEAWWSTQQRQNVSVSGGVMRIALKKEKAGKMEYTAGGLISKPMFRYGYYEARLKCPPGAGWHTSFWAMGARGGKLELDFFENDSINPKRYGVNTHSYVPKNHSVGFKAVNTPDLAADFHVIGGEFTPTNLTYFFNGKPVATFASTNYPHDDMSIWLTSLAASLSGTKAVDETKLPAEALYDYVRFFTKEPEK
jgi:beta-glucanase (GH16 family)